MTSYAILLLIFYWAPVISATSALLLWCSHTIKAVRFGLVRTVIMWIALTLSALTQVIVPCFLSWQWNESASWIASHEDAVVIIMIANGVSFAATVIYAALYLKPLPRNVSRMKDLFHTNSMNDVEWSKFTGGHTNDFNARVGGMAFALASSPDMGVEDFMQGAYWASSMHELLPDEKDFLRKSGEDVAEVQRIMTLMAGRRASGKVMRFSPIPGYGPHPFPVDVPSPDSMEKSL